LLSEAVKVTESPAHIIESVVDILTDGVTKALTVIVIPEEVIVAGLAHAAFDVRIHVTTAPSDNVPEVNIAKLVPAFAPFTCH
jgi:hypothetical protein